MKYLKRSQLTVADLTQNYNKKAEKIMFSKFSILKPKMSSTFLSGHQINTI
jgi:hypothetical protein